MRLIPRLRLTIASGVVFTGVWGYVAYRVALLPDWWPAAIFPALLAVGALMEAKKAYRHLRSPFLYLALIHEMCGEMKEDIEENYEPAPTRVVTQEELDRLLAQPAKE